MPVVSGTPKQIALNFTGIVLFSLNARTGSAKVPPFPFSIEPPIGDRKPLNTLHAVRIVRLSGNERQRVVCATVAVVDRERSDVDCVSADEFAWGSGQRSGERIGESQRAAGDLISEHRIGIAERLGLGIRFDGDGPFLDLEIVAHERQVVVIAAVAVVDCERTDRDRVEADVLAGHSTESAGEGVAECERAARDRVSERRIGIAVGLELTRRRGDLNGPLVDGELGAVVGDDVVVQR